MSEKESSDGDEKEKTTRYEKKLEVAVKGKGDSGGGSDNGDDNSDDDESDDGSDDSGSDKPDYPTESGVISYTHEDADCPEPHTIEVTGKMEFDESLFGTEVKLIREEVSGNEDIQVDVVKDVWKNKDVTEKEVQFKAGNQPEGMIRYRLEFYAISLSM